MTNANQLSQQALAQLLREDAERMRASIANPAAPPVRVGGQSLREYAPSQSDEAASANDVPHKPRR